MTPGEILRAAKGKITDPAHWCQGAEARNEEGGQTHPWAENACQWCAIGATAAVESRIPLVVMCDTDALLNRIAEQMGYPETDDLPPAAHLNDTTDHATVLAMFDRAIQLAERQEDGQ